jgi:hypothetical protein
MWFALRRINDTFQEQDFWDRHVWGIWFDTWKASRKTKLGWGTIGDRKDSNQYQGYLAL